MLTHAQIWTALDRLAALAGLSPSGLAKKSGLDPTTFNKSKRMTSDGRARWPSTESVAKALTATGTSIDTLVQMIEESGRSAIKETVPLIGLAQAGKDGYFDESGVPAGRGWDEIRFPAVDDEHAYALEISGESMAPAYHEGTFVIVSPAASIRRGDRVVLKTAAGEVMVKELKRRTAKSIELRSIDPGARRVHATGAGGVMDRAYRLGKPVRKAVVGKSGCRRQVAHSAGGRVVTA
jgi:phage repressor protein C with HTH and peptisase S24 domain